jgi:hypothetical protein
VNEKQEGVSKSDANQIIQTLPPQSASKRHHAEIEEEEGDGDFFDNPTVVDSYLQKTSPCTNTSIAKFELLSCQFHSRSSFLVSLHHLVRLCFLALPWCLVAPVTCHSVTALHQTASRIALRHRPSNLPIILGHSIIRPSLGLRPFLVWILVRGALVGMGLVCWVAESH